MRPTFARIALTGVAAVTIAAAVIFPSRADLSATKQPVAWVAPMEFVKYDVTGGGAVAYRGDLIRGTWDGELFAYDVDKAGSMTQKWRATDGVPTDANARKIFTSASSGNGVAFRWSGTSTLTATQRSALGDATVGPARLAYLRGDKSGEVSDAKPYSGSSTEFRQRFTRMGAVIHSRPRHHNGTVYVGANDGMLHAIDAASGAERWAYVPSMLIANGALAALGDPLSTDFPYLVDGSVAIGTAGSKTVLVGALGTGGKGLYALDITSPSPSSETLAAAMALWEVTDATSGFGKLGHVVAQPQIATMESGDVAVLVPNGLNSTGGSSSLFIIRASDGTKLAEIAAGTALADGTANALGGISAIDRDGNGRVDTVYAGDLKGTLWKFDLKGSTYPSSATALFAPTGSDARPITAAPTVSIHPQGGLLINFGTGRAYAAADLASTATEYLYGLRENGTTTVANLVTNTLKYTSSSTTLRTTGGTAATYADGNMGWRIALASGERVLGGDLLTTSGRFMVKTSVSTADGVTGNWLIQIDAAYGVAPQVPYFDRSEDGTITTSGNTDRALLGSDYVVPVGYSLGTGVWSQPVLVKLSATLDRPYFNHNPNVRFPDVTAEYQPPEVTGVNAGHFDFDIFYGCQTSKPVNKDCDKKHVHEYDDLYKVVGVNMLNPSLADFNLSKAISSTTQSFKILLANTRWSPAAVLTVGNKSYTMWKWPVTKDGFLADDAGNALTFTRTTLSKFIYALPLDGFVSKDWGTGETRAGLMPNDTGCVKDNDTPTSAWMKGALTIQVVDATATGTNVQANLPTGSGGYRLKDDSTSRALLLAQYTSFWHSDPSRCYGDAGWTASPPAATDNKSAYKGTPAGTDDPTGDFVSDVLGTPSSAPSGGKWTYKLNGVTVTVTTTYDGTGVRRIYKNASGVTVSDIQSDFGGVKTAPVQTGSLLRVGRLGWKELIR